jgi:hypothetical protein
MSAPLERLVRIAILQLCDSAAQLFPGKSADHYHLPKERGLADSARLDKWLIAVSQGFNTKSRDSGASLLADALTKRECGMFEGAGNHSNTPIREVSATHGGNGLLTNDPTLTNWRGGGSDAVNSRPAMSKDVRLLFETVSGNSSPDPATFRQCNPDAPESERTPPECGPLCLDEADGQLPCQGARYLLSSVATVSRLIFWRTAMHSDGSGTPGACGCKDDDDLYSCAEQTGADGVKSGGWVVAPQGRRGFLFSVGGESQVQNLRFEI